MTKLKVCFVLASKEKQVVISNDKRVNIKGNRSLSPRVKQSAAEIRRG